jgi:hypothetical protein
MGITALSQQIAINLASRPSPQRGRRQREREAKRNYNRQPSGWNEREGSHDPQDCHRGRRAAGGRARHGASCSRRTRSVPGDRHLHAFPGGEPGRRDGAGGYRHHHPGRAPRFVVLVQVTNTSSSVQTINCVLPNGHVKTASDTWMRIIRGNHRVTLKAVDSTCGEQPRFSDPRGRWRDLPVTTRSSSPEVIVVSKITHPSSLKSWLVAGLTRPWRRLCRRLPASAILFVLSVVLILLTTRGSGTQVLVARRRILPQWIRALRRDSRD